MLDKNLVVSDTAVSKGVTMCIKNAAELLSAARLLASKSHLRPACLLAFTALEEMGRVGQILFVHLFKSEQELKQWRKSFYSHKDKFDFASTMYYVLSNKRERYPGLEGELFSEGRELLAYVRMKGTKRITFDFPEIHPQRARQILNRATKRHALLMEYFGNLSHLQKTVKKIRAKQLNPEKSS